MHRTHALFIASTYSVGQRLLKIPVPRTRLNKGPVRQPEEPPESAATLCRPICPLWLLRRGDKSGAVRAWGKGRPRPGIAPMPTSTHDRSYEHAPRSTNEGSAHFGPFSPEVPAEGLPSAMYIG
jgi:hypothetical protein